MAFAGILGGFAGSGTFCFMGDIALAGGCAGVVGVA